MTGWPLRVLLLSGHYLVPLLRMGMLLIHVVAVMDVPRKRSSVTRFCFV